MKNKNGFMLSEALFGFLILMICITLLFAMTKLLRISQGDIVHEEIEKEWFYSD